MIGFEEVFGAVTTDWEAVRLCAMAAAPGERSSTDRAYRVKTRARRRAEKRRYRQRYPQRVAAYKRRYRAGKSLERALVRARLAGVDVQALLRKVGL